MTMAGQLEGRSSVTVQVIPKGQGTDSSFSIHVEEIQTVILVKKTKDNCGQLSPSRRVVGYPIAQGRRAWGKGSRWWGKTLESS